MTNILRVFPRQTNDSPDDELVRFGYPSLLDAMLDIREVHISVTFSWDLPRAESLYKAWSKLFPTKLGGPATGQKGEDFVPGMYLKRGIVITSRGCPNKCWFCLVWKREGQGVRELPITEGWDLQDDNLLACSDEHIKKVFAMLGRQNHRPLFKGGLEAKRLKKWHVEELAKLKPQRLFFAYDTPDDREPLFEAGKMLRDGGIIGTPPLRAYVLVGGKNDTFEKAQKRMLDCVDAGFTPFAMLYRGESGATSKEWKKFACLWTSPLSVFAEVQKLRGKVSKMVGPLLRD